MRICPKLRNRAFGGLKLISFLFVKDLIRIRFSHAQGFLAHLKVWQNSSFLPSPHRANDPLEGRKVQKVSGLRLKDEPS